MLLSVCAAMQFRLLISRALPVVVSCGLLAFVVWWVSPQELLQAARNLRWQLLLPITGVMVLALYLCDALCLPIVYSLTKRNLRYGEALHVRGLSYLGGAFNYELGQAGIAWGVAKLLNVSLLRMLSRSVVLAYHDAVILLSMGLVGAWLSDDSRLTLIAVALLATLIVGAVLWNLLEKLRLRAQSTKLGAILADWSFGRSVRLVPLRVTYFGILVIYATVALHICEIPIDNQVVLGTIPLVLLAEGLPNFAGLGTRETALLLLLDPPNKGLVLAMSLFWSSGMIVFRLLIGLGHLWYHSFVVVRRKA
jgi:hypothetical protein